jgi:Rrf2 family iron-sulfur cluster assembly transcriptional regulator
MRLTSKGRYAVRALYHLAYHHEGQPAQMRSIAEHARIPLRFLEQIFHELKRAGILTAKRGPRGGYQLARSSAQITLGDVVRALEGSAFALTRSDERDAGRDPVARTLVDLAHGIERCFDAISLADVCKNADRFGIARTPIGRSKDLLRTRRTEEGPEYAI